MRLDVVTPTGVAVEEPDVVSVTAEDASGRFGILPRHADLVTALAVSVLTWRRRDGVTSHCAVRGGILTVRGGQEVAVATQQAIPGDDLETLESEVLARLRTAEEEARDARIHARRLHVAALQQLLRFVRPGATGPATGGMPHRDGVVDGNE